MKIRGLPDETILDMLQNSAQESDPAQAVRRLHGIDHFTFGKWSKTYSGMSQSKLNQLRSLEREVQQLRRQYAELALLHFALKDAYNKLANELSRPQPNATKDPNLKRIF